MSNEDTVDLPDNALEHVEDLVRCAQQGGAEPQAVKVLIDQLAAILNPVENNMVVIGALATALWAVLKNEEADIPAPGRWSS